MTVSKILRARQLSTYCVLSGPDGRYGMDGDGGDDGGDDEGVRMKGMVWRMGVWAGTGSDVVDGMDGSGMKGGGGEQAGSGDVDHGGGAGRGRGGGDTNILEGDSK
ncbi:hypothetical protein B9Z19DRAFT_1066946 [Tuber borchii]|uniref:Uncharacterized protein n=1 Tax=Tuber borchii TaxID=42251 RepID=A0A2T6ZKP0_TUBBO|nr:hypothetical protein B9Z19DRAFT_1066946 [Tuber borchii]